MGAERRRSERKVVRRPVVIAVGGRPVAEGKTLDVSMEGLSLVVSNPMKPGAKCAVSFDLPRNGKFSKVSAAARVVWCALSGGEGFHVGLEFETVDAAAAKAIDEFLS
ncbi:MAG TPA: PilZ domain-containing protein [Burkholderiaceae bacterium]|nr:PilZ domain-containing protein [Burkholderiaceae bacterium]